MRRSIEDLRAFYDEPVGALARRLILSRIEQAWGEAVDCDVLGLGYASPYLEGFVGARRVLAAMPSGQGVEIWPLAGRNRSLLVDDRALPFAAGAFDRLLLVHSLEEADDPHGMLTEAVRVLSPAGRLMLVVAARGGLWSRVETTPFGHGRPFTRRQLERLVREVGLEPTAWSHTLFTPPWRPLVGLTDGIEPIGRRLVPNTAGVVLLEAARRTYARARPKGAVANALALPPALRPSPVARDARDLA